MYCGSLLNIYLDCHPIICVQWAALTKIISRCILWCCSTVFISSLIAVSAVHAADQSQAAVNTEPSFGFIKNPPGELFDLGHLRLHVNCKGEGEVTVLFEPGLGGSSMEWQPLQEALAGQVKTCIYDRAGYAWSDPGTLPRHVTRLAAEAHLLLQEMKVEGPLILVGHSFGGMIVRMLANLRSEQLVGLVLVDTSHEDQFERLNGADSTDMLPKTNNFVISQPEIPSGLRQDIAEKIYAFSRMRKTYAALHGELSSFGDSARQVKRARKVFDFPVTVIQRGTDPYTSDDGGRKNKIWQELQSDLVALSESGELVVAENSGHHIHIDEPEVVVDVIRKMAAASR